MSCHIEKSNKLKSILWEQREISRQRLIKLSGMNPRTVSKCMKELAERQLISITDRTDGQGRPSQYYKLRMKTLRLLHFTVTRQEIYAIVCDLRQFPLCLIREDFSLHTWQDKHPELLNAKLKSLAVGVLESAVMRNGFIIAACLEFMLPQQPLERVRQRWSDTLENILQCDCPVFNVDAVLLSQYQVNNHLGGRIIGISYREDVQCVAVESGHISESLQLRAEKVLDEAGMKNMSFANFIREFHRDALNWLQDFEAEDFYNVVCTRAIGGDEYSELLLRGYGRFLGRLFVKLAENLKPEYLVLMHPRQIVCDGVQEAIGQMELPCRILPVNFSSNEFILAPSGYLRRGLMKFEHGRYFRS